MKTLTASVCLSFAMFLVAPASIASQDEKEQSGVSTATSIYTARLGNVTLRFDRKYLGSSNKACEQDSCSLYALLPDLQPAAPDRIGDFNYNGPDSRRFLLFLTHSPRFRYKGRDEKYREYVERGYIERDGEETVFGMQRHKSRARGFKQVEFYSGITAQGNFVFVECSIEGIFPSPQCEASYLWKSNIAVRYVFKRHYLPQSIRIQENVDQLLESFWR